ncbi:M20/M25/M40 family metallo-hydrolase [Acrocarpospora catenulata]|uniref:M20/M25/M40 family metallo-hydrolase n=1 Tax=Acrocarpospora catenulata TaxID=2836182 RepID=UPI001BDB0997|nr:M20/M25/M40 family metallo-hydrolase [Acrocarpospora catenulata]
MTGSVTETAVAEAGRVIERTIELSLIPAPPLQEAARAERVAGWWRADGLAEVAIDPTGNVWARVRAGSGPAILVAAHLDTVFGHDVRHGLTDDGAGRLVGPGCGDDTVAVAALSVLDRLLPERTGGQVWIVATVGEEGLGNLRGVTAALDRPPVPLGALIALEGNYLGRVNLIGVGSVRKRVTVTAPGGHAWEDPHVPSAVHVAAGMIHDLARLRPGGDAKATVNIGTLHGGESINARARRCVFDLDLRSADEPTLRLLEDGAREILERVPAQVNVAIEEIGNRPAGRLAEDHPLVLAAEAALRTIGVEPRHTAASTDANAAYRIGLPAVTLGITYGDGTHTEAEWIETGPVPLGLQALAATILTYGSQGE